jgi:hypothetical protein
VLFRSVLTVSSISGLTLNPASSASFSILEGNLYRTLQSGDWDQVEWELSLNGGHTWDPVDGEPGYNELDVITIPADKIITINRPISLYNMIIDGSLEILNNGSITLNHSANSIGYQIHVHGELKNSGGDIINTDNTFPIDFHGGTYWHNRNGGTVPKATWRSRMINAVDEPSLFKVTGITNNPIAGGLNQDFQQIEWDNIYNEAKQNGFDPDAKREELSDSNVVYNIIGR